VALVVERLRVPRPQDQTRGVHVGLVHGGAGLQRPRPPAGERPLHRGPGVAGRGQLRRHGHVRGLRAGRQGDGRPRGHRVLHHRRRGLHPVRWVEGEDAMALSHQRKGPRGGSRAVMSRSIF